MVTDKSIAISKKRKADKAPKQKRKKPKQDAVSEIKSKNESSKSKKIEDGVVDNASAECDKKQKRRKERKKRASSDDKPEKEPSKASVEYDDSPISDDEGEIDMADDDGDSTPVLKQHDSEALDDGDDSEDNDDSNANDENEDEDSNSDDEDGSGNDVTKSNVSKNLTSNAKTSAKGDTNMEIDDDDRDKATDGVLTKRRFNELEICDKTLDALKDMEIDRMTEIQARCIPHGLAGRDILGAARTGSGKTLAFLIPVVELLHRVKWTNRNGTAAVIITPTRELALQIYGVVAELCKFHSQTYGNCIGGTNRKTEAQKLEKGIAILVGTPGRLLDHMHNTPGFIFKNLLTLIIDEADRCLDIGFEEEMHQIIKLFPKKRQTLLFSATQTTKVDDLVRVSFKNKPIYVGVHDKNISSTVQGLDQGYVVVSSANRFLLLYSFLRRNLKKKIIVFMSSCNAVKFYYELLNHVNIPVMDLYGRMKQTKRTTTFYNFCKAEKAILISTDVAARGLDIPAVDWIIQFDPPDEPKEYIHRVGRTARGVNSKGKALLFLLPCELGFLRHLQALKVPLNEYEFPTDKISRVQPQLEKLVKTNYALNKSAKSAYRSYLLAYYSSAMKDIFNVHNLDINEVASSFCFDDPPHINLDSIGGAKGDKRRQGSRNKSTSKLKEVLQQQKTGHTFSASNPYGKREASDKRQFSR